MNKKYLPHVILIFIVFALLFLFFTKDKTGYVDNNKLYKEFKGTKDLEEKLKTNLESERQIIDSLNQVAVAVEKMFKTKNPSIEEITTYKQLLTYNDSLKYIYQLNLKEMNNKISIQVWNTLSEYIIEYGKKYHYKYIFGASGNGNLMYASDKKNLTEDVIKFANKKYEDQ